MRSALAVLLALGLCVVATAQTPPPAATAGGAAPAALANPYSATVPVAGTSDAQRNEAIAAALTEVLQQQVPGFAPDEATLAKASGYVRDYHYRRAPAGTGLELQVDFDPAAVGRLVAQASSGALAAAAPAGTSGAAASPAAAGSGAPTAAAQVAVSGTGTVWVDGIDSTHAFASLLSLLRGTPQLRDVIPVAAEHDGVLLQVAYSQPLGTVLAALETSTGHLAPATLPHPGADASLRWLP